MAAYLLVRTKVLDEDRYAGYKVKAMEAIRRFGGEPVIGAGEQGILEGESDDVRHIVIRFETLQAVKDFYASSEYQAARRLREGAVEIEMFFAEGA